MSTDGFVCNAEFPLIGGSRDKVHLHVINLADRAKIFFPFDVEPLDLHASARKTGGICRENYEKIRKKCLSCQTTFIYNRYCLAFQFPCELRCILEPSR